MRKPVCTTIIIIIIIKYLVFISVELQTAGFFLTADTMLVNTASKGQQMMMVCLET